MSDGLSVLFDRILADENLRIDFQEMCSKGWLHGEGRRVRHIASEQERGHWGVTPVVEPGYKPIPAEDWVKLSLIRIDGELRLEGTRKWFVGEWAYEPKAWTSIRFPESDFANLKHFAVLKRRAGAKSTKRHAVTKYLAENFPNGIPPDYKNAAICADMSKVGLKVSDRTLRRAQGRK